MRNALVCVVKYQYVLVYKQVEVSLESFQVSHWLKSLSEYIDPAATTRQTTDGNAVSAVHVRPVAGQDVWSGYSSRLWNISGNQSLEYIVY